MSDAVAYQLTFFFSRRRAFDKITFSQHRDQEGRAATSHGYIFSYSYIFQLHLQLQLQLQHRLFILLLAQSSQHHARHCFPARNHVVANSVIHHSFHTTRQRHTESKKSRSILFYSGLFWSILGLVTTFQLYSPLLHSKSIFAPLVQFHYHFIQAQWPEKTTTSYSNLVQASLYSHQWYQLLPLHSNPLAREDYRFQALVQAIPYSRHWYHLLPLFPNPLARANCHFESIYRFNKPPIRTRALALANHSIKPTGQTGPDQTRSDQIRLHCSETAIHNPHSCDMVIFCSHKTGILHLISTGEHNFIFL